jgi:hypothetical protein
MSRLGDRSVSPTGKIANLEGKLDELSKTTVSYHQTLEDYAKVIEILTEENAGLRGQ